MAKFKSVIGNFDKVKNIIKEEKEKKASGGYNNPSIFKPQMVKGQPETEFRIRFLDMEESSTGKPWKQINYHMFERPGDGRFVKVIDPRTFDPKASNPIADYGFKLYKSENALDKEFAKKLYKKERYFAFVYVKEAPENQKEYVGKVLIFEFGKKLIEKLENAIKRSENCFWDPYKGQDLALVIKETGGWPDYTQSEFVGMSGPIVKDETEMDRICDDLAKLSIQKNIIEKDGIKSSVEMKQLLEGGMGELAQNNSSTPKTPKAKDLLAESAPKQPAKPAKEEPEFGNESIAATVPAEKAESATPAAEDGDDINLDDINFEE